MKKFITIMLLSILPLFIMGSSQAYVNVPKKDSVVLNVNTKVTVAENKKQTLNTENLNIQLVRAVDNQTKAVSVFDSTLNLLNKSIENRNKLEGKLITSYFGYSPNRIKEVYQKEKWLILLSIAITFCWLIYVRLDPGWKEKEPLSAFSLKLIFYGVLTIAIYYVALVLLTLLANGDYYVLKELTALHS